MSQTNVKVEVVLSEDARCELEAIVRSKSSPVGKVRKARVLLLADEDRREGRRPDWYISEQVGVSLRQISRIRQQFMREGASAALGRKKRSDAGTQKTFDGVAEARLVALCCSDPPQGRQRWSLRLLVSELERLEVVADVCVETVRQCLKKIASSHGERSASASRKETALASSRGSKRSSMSTTKRTTSAGR